MAEAVCKFQNATPKRFRTTSAVKTKQNALRGVRQSTLTASIPVVPALRCKLRARSGKVLNHEEREEQEVQESRNNLISSLRVVPLAQKRAPVSGKVPELKSSREPRSKVTVPSVVSTIDGITVKEAEILHFGIPDVTTCRPCKTKIIPFSFEKRNKELQKRKEEKLKKLLAEEENKMKVSFHARPLPNFKKSVTTGVKEPLAPKSNVKLCPFSFEDRDKNSIKKKEDLIKAVIEEDKKARMFHANPVPEFKPVLVRGTSKENLSGKGKSSDVQKGRNSMFPAARANSKSCLFLRTADQENEKPTFGTSKPNEMLAKPESNNAQKLLQEFHLNTDKRAKERREFDERIRQKELEHELLKKNLELERLAKEEAENAQIRRKAEIKARPLPSFKPPVVIHSDKQLTVPLSPGWSKKPKH